MAASADLTGWARVDRAVAEIRVQLSNAKTEEQFQSIGLLCRETLINLADVVHDPIRHPTADGVTPSATDAGRRLEAYITAVLSGSGNDAARRQAKAALALANDLQHRRTATYQDAALCVEATSSVINLIAIMSGQQARDPGLQSPPVHVDHVRFDNLAGVAAYEGGFNEIPTLFLVSFPVDVVELSDINGGPKTPLIKLLSNPPSLRASGFDLTVGDGVRVVRSGLRRLSNPRQTLLELHRDGTLIFLVNARDALCSWGIHHDPNDPLRINPLGLAETVYNFVELSRHVSEELRPRPRGFGFDLGMWRMESNGYRASLGPGSLHDRAYDRRRGFQPAPDSNHLVRLDWLNSGVDVGLVVNRLLEEFYAWFGLTADDVPYRLPGERRIDPERLRLDW